MFDFAQKYQASVFGNFLDILPTPDMISKMLELFRDKNLLPSTFQEISPQFMGPQPRLRLSSQNNEWNINFATNRMDIEKNPTNPIENNFGSVEDFVAEANQLFDRTLNEFSRKAKRISCVTSGLLKPMGPEKMEILFNKLFSPIEFYRNTPPFEWNSRFASRVVFDITGAPEQVNAITSINRVHGHIFEPDTMVGFDRIEIGFDINTNQENQETRFDTSSLAHFYKEATLLRRNLLTELETFFNG